MPVRAAAAAPRRLPLATAGMRTRLVFYPPGLRQPPHHHERVHVSIIIAGAIREVSAGRDEIGVASAQHLRREGTHEVEFGPHGALILAADLERDDPLARTPASGWVHRSVTAMQRTLLRWVLVEGAARQAD